MRRFTRWLLVLGAIALPYPAHAQYYYYPTPAYYYNTPQSTYYAPQYPYGYQGGAASYYSRVYPQSQPAYSYPSPSYSYPSATYSSPSTSYYTTTAQPMPSAPNYYPTTPAAPPLPPKTHDLPGSISPPPVLNDSTGDSESIKPTQPEPVHIKDKQQPEVITIHPPTTAGTPAGPTLPAEGTEEVHPDGAACTNCQKPAKTCHIFGFADALYWNVRGANLPFAQAFDSVGPLAVPRGSVGMAMPGYALGVEAGFGVGLDEHSCLMFSGIYYDNNTHSQVGATDGNVLHSFLVFPATVNSAPDSLLAHANSATRLETAQVDYKFAFWNTDQFELSFIGGARYAHLQQLLSSDFQILGTTTVDSKIVFDGAGIRTGLEGEYRTKSGIYGYAKGLVDLLGGHFSANYIQQNVFSGLQAQTQFGEDRIVPILELELGVGWISPRGHICASAGYYVGAWFNTLTMPSLIQGIQASNFTTNSDNFRDTLTFDGFVGKIEFRF